jgi:PadR family transcriptional regulator, regulatory protein AphA
MDMSEPAEYALLGLLWDGPRHGYELHHAFAPDQELGAICHLELSQLYAFLKKLEALGYLESTLEPQEGRPPRRMVGLTRTGRHLFRQWVQAPVPRPREVRLLFLLKLYFARTFGTATTLTLITRQIEACAAFLTKLQEGPPEASSEDSFALKASPAFQDFRTIVHQARIRQIEATIGWLTALQDQAEAIARTSRRETSVQTA